jgi:hypothetical protein
MSIFNTITRAADFAFSGGGGTHGPRRPDRPDPGVVPGHSTDPTAAHPRGHAPPPSAEERARMEQQGHRWVDDPGYWALTDHFSPDPSEGSNLGVETHDHSSSNPSTWTVEEWKAALKRDPEKYTRLFQELATTDGGLSKDVQDHRADMNTLVATTLQDFNRDMTFLKSIIDANHETLKALAQFRV